MSSPQFRVACLMAGKSARRELKFICRHKETTQGESKKEKLVTSGVCYASMLQRETNPINSKTTQKNGRGKKRQLRSTLIATVILKANEKLSGEEKGKREGLLSSPPPLPSSILTRQPLPWNHFWTRSNSESVSMSKMAGRTFIVSSFTLAKYSRSAR